ncbi:OTU domain-containing protein [Tanacetum coccineum]
MDGDGNCVLRSFSDQFWETQERHLEVREAACSQLMRFPQLYGYSLDDHDAYYDYVDFMSWPSSWADARLAFAACDAYHVRLVELVSLPGYMTHDFIPYDGYYNKIIYFCSSSVHSDSMYRVGDEIPLSPGRMQKMRRTGRFYEPEVVNRGTHTVFSSDMLDDGVLVFPLICNNPDLVVHTGT